LAVTLKEGKKVEDFAIAGSAAKAAKPGKKAREARKAAKK
jgi:hypothetical protein